MAAAAIDSTPTAPKLGAGLVVHDKRAPLSLLAQPTGGLPRNTVPSGAPWPTLSPACAAGLLGGGSYTPATMRGLTLSLQGTPCSIPMLPLLSLGITPSLGFGLDPLAASSTTGVVSVATDPLSLHFVNLNMMTVDVDEASMDALMQQLLEDSPLAPTLAASPRMRLTPPQPQQPTAASSAGQQCPHSASRSLFKAPELKGCGEDNTAEEVQETALLHSGGGKALARARAIRRRSSVFTSDEALRDVKVAAKRMQDSPALVMLPLYDGGSGAVSDCSGGACTFGLGGLDSEGLQAMESMEVEGMHRVQAGVGSTGQQRGAAAAAAPAKPAAAAQADGELHVSLTVPFLEENGYFDMTLQQAAVELGVGVTTLKKLCRQNGLGRWPYRARCSLRNLRDKMRGYFACAPAEEREAADALMGREFSRLARMSVGAIDEAVKQFRQAMFKLEFKARQQLEAGRGNGGGRKRPTASSSAAGSSGEGGEELSSIIQFDETIRQQAMLHLRRLLTNCGEEM
ncbi:hypothetical protein ABPG75_011483 [Micractinium tetrahymenae]